MGTKKKRTAPAAGPWIAKISTREASDGIDVFDTEGNRVAYVPPDDTFEHSGGLIVEVCSDRQKANARQITMSPRLVDALADLVTSADCDNVTEAASSHVLVTRSKIEAARALLAELRGAK